jgi:hypothetical protein
MVKKSIADLRRYKKFLIDMLKQFEFSAVDNIFDSGEVDNFNMSECLSLINSVRSTLIILDQEIKIASMSNSISIDEEIYSIYQAKLMVKSSKETLEFLQKLSKTLIEGKGKPEIFKFRRQTIGYAVLDTQISNLQKKIYILKDKIEREEARTIIEIDMDSLIPISLTETT